MENISITNLDEWTDVKIFRDTVHQYIEMPKVYVRYLIDTYDMQRIKDVAQSGIRSVFNAATHDRFSHSLGVYHLGKKAFKSLKKNIKNIVANEYFQKNSGDSELLKELFDREWKSFEEDLDIWEVLFHVACVLHDIGHPAMSHTLEFLYDDIYMDIYPQTSDDEDNQVAISDKEYIRFKKLHEQYEHGNRTGFQAYLGKMLLDDEEQKVQGNPHERMSAYYIISGVTLIKEDSGKYVIEEIVEDSLAKNIENLIRSFYKHEYKNKKIFIEEKVSANLLDYLRFICRMIIGHEYDCHESDGIKCVQYSIRNAIVSLLNGKIDADSLDYITRNSYSAGYDTNSIDVNRLCTSYSVRFQDNMFKPVFEKNAISVLEGFISARNFEPNWLYSHHKIVYNIDVLYKYMFRCAVEMLYTEDLDEWSDIILKNFFGVGQHIENSPIYKTCIKNIRNSDEVVLSRDEQKEIYLKLKKVCISQDVESELMSLIMSDSEDMDTKNHAELIKHKLRFGGNEQQYKEGGLNRELEELLSGKNKLASMKDDILEYIDKIQVLNEVVDRILNRKSGDIPESRFKLILKNTKLYLANLLIPENMEKLEKSEKDGQDLYNFLNTLLKRYSELTDIKNLYFSYILSPSRSFMNKRFLFYRSNDSDIDALFKSWYFKLKNEPEKGKLTSTEKTYFNLGREYFERKYKTSLWKSYQEYKIFIDGIAKKINMDASEVNEYLLDIIQKWGEPVRFHSNGQDTANSLFENQTIYIYDKEYNSGDNKPDKEEFQELFSDFADTDFIIKVHVMKYKDFRNSVKIAFKEKVFPLGEVIDLVEMKDKKFPFIFLKFPDESEDEKGKQRRHYMDMLEEKLTRYCLHKSRVNSIIKREAFDDIMINGQGKMFRDVVHGDILIPKRFVPLIETSAFQRLRRIKQLSTADMVFPNAGHTRFAHSIGTFHIMTLIVKHFQEMFQELGVSYNKMDIDALLAAALLHDIGHGPYSHNFERLFDQRKKHEEWGVEIIENDKEIRDALTKGFSEEQYNLDKFIKQITFYIRTEKARGISSENLSFRTIFKSLISSELDADRLDYLLRDSFNTGMGYGKVDVGMIIQGMQVIEIGNKFYVCIAESAISYIEQFVFGRYKMYDSVYHNAYKVFSESLVLKILEYARKNADSLNLENSVDNNISAMLNNKLELKGYLALDDSYVNSLFNRWQDSEDLILSKMCKAFLTRSSYSRLYIMNQTAEDMYVFERELESVIQSYFPNFGKKAEDLYSFVFTKREFAAYNPKTDDSKIWIQTSEGLVKDFAEVSPMFSNVSKKTSWNTQKTFIYYSRELLEAELDSMKETANFTENKKALLSHIDQIINNSNLRKHIEIEEKYACSPEELNAVKNMLEGRDKDNNLSEDYNINSLGETKQIDIYYDTDDMRIAKKNCSFRCRSKSDGRYKITIKAPTPNAGFDKESQVARFEYEKEIKSSDLTEAIDFIRLTLKEVLPDEMTGLTKDNFDNLFKPQLTVENLRSKYMVTNAADEKGFRFSVCLDRVIFQHETLEDRNDYQIEVELESDYMHRVSMKFFTAKIEEKLGNVKHEQYSKYIKGLDVLGIYHP